MSSECSICEHDTRGPHALDCPRYKPPRRCSCGGEIGEEWECKSCGEDGYYLFYPRPAPTPEPQP